MLICLLAAIEHIMYALSKLRWYHRDVYLTEQLVFPLCAALDEDFCAWIYDDESFNVTYVSKDQEGNWMSYGW